MSSENIASFVAITNSDPETAEKYLEFSGNDLESAVTFFFESGGSIGSTSSNNAPENGATDAELAQRLQQESYDVRAPDETVRERLIDDDGDNFNMFDYASLAARHNTAPLPFSQRGIFNQYETDRIEEDEDGYDDGANDENTDDEAAYDRQFGNESGLTEHQKRLGRLFRPPFDLIQKLTIAAARKKGQQEKKWILINIQDLSNFQCQVLNRDFWSDFDVKRVVSRDFIFLQYQNTDFAVEEYIQFNNVEKYPYIAILDPFSGERFKLWTEVPDVRIWVNEVTSFLERFSLTPGHKNPAIKHKSKVDVSALSEEQQLELAMKKSMSRGEQSESEDEKVHEVNNYFNPISLDSDEEQSEPEFEDDEADSGKTVTTETTNEKEEVDDSPETVFDRIPAAEYPEPSGETTKIQIRFGDGSRVVKTFGVNDPVKVIYQSLKAEYPQTQDKFFSLMCQRENLIGKVDMSIKEAGLMRSSIMVDVDDDE